MKRLLPLLIPFVLLTLFSCKNYTEKEDKSIVPAETRSTLEYNQKQLDTVPASNEQEIVFSANGGEPFWSAEITSKTIRFETPEQSITSDVEKAEVSGNTTSIVSNFEQGAINASIVKENCQDGMSGEEHSHKIELEIKYNDARAANTFNGCGSYNDI